MAVLFGRPKRYAMREPVHTPVPGRGTATKATSAGRLALAYLFVSLLALSITLSYSLLRGRTFVVARSASRRPSAAGSAIESKSVPSSVVATATRRESPKAMPIRRAYRPSKYGSRESRKTQNASKALNRNSSRAFDAPPALGCRVR